MSIGTAMSAYSQRPRGIASQNTRGEAQNSRGVAGGEAARVVAHFERVKAVRAGADERRIVVVPRFGPVAAEQVAERFAKLIGDDQADAGDEQRVLPALATAQTHGEQRAARAPAATTPARAAAVR